VSQHEAAMGHIIKDMQAAIAPNGKWQLCQTE